MQNVVMMMTVASSVFCSLRFLPFLFKEEQSPKQTEDATIIATKLSKTLMQYIF